MTILFTFIHELLVESSLRGTEINDQVAFVLVGVDVVEASEGKILCIIADGVSFPGGFLDQMKRYNSYKSILMALYCTSFSEQK